MNSSLEPPRTVVFALCGSFCTFETVLPQIIRLRACGWEVLPMLSYAASALDTRFGRAADWKQRLEEATGHRPLEDLREAEPLGPKHVAQALVIAPCTGTTMALLAAGIEPYVTLYHWDLPQALQDKGGWLNADTARAFAVYAATVAAHFKGRVKYYFTINEPQCSVGLGYSAGVHAPGYKLDDAAVFTAWHNTIYAHCLAADAIRKADPDAKVGMAPTGRICTPATDSPADIAAAREATFALADGDWTFTYTPALDPVCGRGWPKIAGGQAQRVVDAIPQEQLDALPLGRLDFIGMNIYNSVAVRAGADGKPEFCPRAAGHPRTAIGWPITPEAMEWGPRFLHERYGLPIFITENGLSCTDRIHLDGKVHDPERIDFTHRYLLALRQGIEAGADVQGYFHWSLLDNFEWSEGYNERFGLVYVDYPTGTRTPKDSAAWYRETIDANGGNL